MDSTKSSLLQNGGRKGISRSLFVGMAAAMLTTGAPCLPMFASSPNQMVQTQSGKVQGKVVDQTGEPLIGVSIQVKGTQQGTVTDMDGNFYLDAAPGATLVVSYIGYQTQTLKASSTMNITMQDDSQSLDELVVIGYGTMKKKLVTGATTQVKGDDIMKLNTTTALQALQGQTPGVNIAATSGQPGADMNVTIRGLGTIGNSQPLYIIDGVAGDMTLLNPADIERIDVLKDAASAAIYGAQAANGVILVTTKSGQEGKGKITYDGYVGWQSVPRKFEMLNAQEYMTIMDEARLNSGMSPVDWQSIDFIHDANGNVYDTDWINQAFEDGALTTSHNLSVTGGSKTSTYVVSGGYMGQDGVVGGSDVSYYKRYNFRANSEHKLHDGMVVVGEHVGFAWKDSRGMSTGNIWNNNLRSAFAASPINPVYDAYGNYSGTKFSDWNPNDGNPYGNMMSNRFNRSQGATLDANAYMQIEPLKGLKFKTVFGISYNSSEYRSYTPQYEYTAQNAHNISEVSQSNGHGKALTWTNTLSYDFTLKGGHAINTLFGTEWSRYDGNYTRGSNNAIVAGFDDWEHAYLSNTEGTQSIYLKGAPYDDTRGMSFFWRAGWTWKERYMINATLRADKSSKFAEGHRTGWFPSVSGGWTISEEKFMASTKSWMDFLKLRVSWGQVGNANVPCYRFLAPVTTENTHYNFGKDGGQTGWSTGAYPNRLANPELKWETSEQFNVGIDARFINSRLALTTDFYIKTTKDWLIHAPTLITSGVSEKLINGGDVKNTGVEISLTWNDNIGKDFHYNIGGNFAYNHNKVINIPTPDGIHHGKTNQVYTNAEEYYRAEDGHALGYFWGFKTAGIFQNQQEINDWIAAGNGILQSDVQPGDVKYVDINHDGAINADDKVELGNGMPKYTFGLNLGCEWKGFDLSMNFMGAAGFKIVQSYRDPSSSQGNYSRAILDRWTGEGTSNTMPRVTYGDVGNWLFSDLYLHTGDYIRLQNLTIGYDFKRLIAWKGISKLRLYVQAQNLFTLTKYDGMDPAIGSYNGNDGNAGDTWVSAVDMGHYPQPRTFIIGANIAF